MNNMKIKIMFLLLMMFFINGCSNKDGGEMIVDEKIPTKVIYRRMWEYSVEAKSEDQELIKELLQEINDIKLGNKTQMSVDDYTDVVIFEYSDGSYSKYIFEANIYVENEENRYEVIDGLSKLRKTLSSMIEGE